MGAAPVVLVVDTGVDDAAALLVAGASPELAVAAVACCAGNAALGDVVDNTRAVLALAGRNDIEICSGASAPLTRPPPPPGSSGHGSTGRGYARLPEHLAPLSRRVAVEALVDLARQRAGELTVVALAPLTDVALAVEREPRLPDLLRRLVVMGGLRPDATAAETNLRRDPAAAHVVARAWRAAGQRPLVIGVGVTRSVTLRPLDIETVARGAGARSPLLDYLRAALRGYAEHNAAAAGVDGSYLHDAVAVAGVLQPRLLDVRAMPDGTDAAVAVDVDAARALVVGRLIRALRQAHPRASPKPGRV